VKKAEPNKLISRKLAANLELFIVCFALLSFLHGNVTLQTGRLPQSPTIYVHDRHFTKIATLFNFSIYRWLTVVSRGNICQP